MDRNDRLKNLADALIPEAVEWVAELRAYRIYQGKDEEYFRKARIGLGIVSSGVRLCATIENAKSNDLIERRLLHAEFEPTINALPPVNSEQ